METLYQHSGYEELFKQIKRFKMKLKLKDLHRRIRKSADESRKITLLIKLALKLHKKESKEALKIAQEALEISQKLNDKSSIAESLSIIGICQRMLSQYDDSIDSFNKSFKIYEELNNSEGQATLKHHIGSVYMRKGELQRALDYFLESYKMYEGIENKNSLPGILTDLGGAYATLHDYSKALKYYFESLSINETVNDQAVFAITYNNIGNIYSWIKNYQQALNYYDKSLEIHKKEDNRNGEAQALGNIAGVYFRQGELDKTLDYYTQVLTIFKEIGNKGLEAQTLGNISSIYSELGQYEKALEFLFKAMEISESIGRIYNYTSILHLIGDVYQKKGDNKQSIEYLEKALKYAVKQGYKRLEYLIYKSLSESYSQLGDMTKSLDYFKEYSKIKDDIHSEEKKQAITELQLNFDLERTQKEKEIAEREKELYYLKNVELGKALNKVETLNAHLVELDYEKNEMLGIVAHDLRNPLSTIIMIANILSKEAKELNDKDVGEYAEDIKTTSNKMINLIKDLLDVNAMESGKLNLKLEPVDICQSAESVTSEFQEHAKLKDIKLDYVPGMNGLKVNADNDATVQVLDNLISNAVKYTQKGGNIEVRVKDVNGTVRLEVEDNGPGIKSSEKNLLFKKFSKLSTKPTGGESSTGLGLSIVKKLTEAMHGKVWCESVEGKGSVFIVELEALKK